MEVVVERDVTLTPSASTPSDGPGSASPGTGPDPAVTAPALTAAQAAVAAGDTGAFRAARRAERAGQPLPAPSVEAASAEGAAPGEPAKALSKRQEAANAKIREAVQRATEQLAQENARLRQMIHPPVQSGPSASAVPDWKRIATLPEAPKLAQFDSVEEHAAAMALFVQDTVQREHAQRARAEVHDQAVRQQSEHFAGQIRAAAAADPDFPNKLPPQLREAVPLSGLPAGAPVTFDNLVMEAAYRSADPGGFLVRLLDSPADLKRILALPPSQHLFALFQLDGRFAAAAQSSSPSRDAGSLTAPAPTLSTAPTVPTLGSRPATAADPKAAAINSPSTRAYRELRRQERAAAMGRR